LYSIDIHNHNNMQVQKRGNRGLEDIKFDKITLRIQRLAELEPCKVGENVASKLVVTPVLVAQQVIKNIYNNIHVEQLDVISANVAESMKIDHPDYGILAGRILVSNLHKTTNSSFSQTMYALDDELNIMDMSCMKYITEHSDELDAAINHYADYMFDYNAMMILQKQFLHRIKKTTVVYDRPQYMFMRVAIQVVVGSGDRDDSCDRSDGDCSSSDGSSTITRVIEMYNGLSAQMFTYATPTNFNSMTRNAQLNSCFLLGTKDSIEGIMTTVFNTALISKRAGGIGIAMSNIRTAGSFIKGTNGISDGVFPQLKIYDANALCWNQGGGKRKGSVAIYTEAWNADIQQILQLKLNQGSDEIRARNLFYSGWTPDLFMIRLLTNQPWSLFSEDTAPGLSKVFDGMLVCTVCGGCDNFDLMDLDLSFLSPPVSRFRKCTLSHADASTLTDVSGVAAACTFSRRNVFTELYTWYEKAGVARKQVDPREIEDAICLSQRENGGPYSCFKDHANRQSNHQGIGTIQSSNLCAEIYQWHNNESYACCSLASINLTKFVTGSSEGNNKKYDFASLHKYVKMVVVGLESNVRNNDYPVEACSVNALQFSPIAIGVQGLANVFCALGLPYVSAEAELLDVKIFETIYHAALEASCELADKYGSHSKFESTPLASGVLRMDLWNENQALMNKIVSDIGQTRPSMELPSTMYDWDAMRTRVKKGVRCSLHVAVMPTVTTAMLFKNNESVEPIPNILYTKNTLAGKLTICNEQLQRALLDIGLWDSNMSRDIVNNGGSVQGIERIPAKLREVYKTVWEIKQTDLMRRSALRQAYIDQGQSLNIHTTVNTDARLRGIFRAGWLYGLNTGSYYVRTTSTVEPLKNNIAASIVRGDVAATSASIDAVCEIGCMSCGS
jgi:ribonucleotide reductase alpha subunit